MVIFIFGNKYVTIFSQEVKNLVKDIGNRIAEIRRERGLSQDELAELSRLSRISIARYETGKIEPGAKALGRIAEALDISSDVLLGRIDEEEMKEDIKKRIFGQIPKTAEARTVSAGMDELKPEQRQMIVNMVSAMYPEVFKPKK